MLEPPETEAALFCTQCSHRAVWPFQLDLHIQRNHLNVYATEIFHAKLQPELYTCVFCGIKTYYKLDLYEHFQSQHTDGTEDGTINEIFESRSPCYEGLSKQSCVNCKYKGHSVLSFTKHLDSCKASLQTPIQLETVYVKSTEITLLDGATPIDNCQCPHCSYKATTKRDLRNHIIVKHAKADEIQWWNCTKCSYRAKIQGYLKNHMLIRHATSDEVNLFNCAQCSYRSYRKVNLDKHILTHVKDTETKWYNCPSCSYRAKSKRTLSRHKHLDSTREAPLKAPVQLETVNVKSTEITFIDDATPIDIRQCPHCSYKAKTKRDLKNHMIVKHTKADEIQWWNCTKCSYRAKLQGYLKSHMLKHVSSFRF